MHSNKYQLCKLGLSAALFGLLSAGSISAQAEDLNVCAGQDEMPFSNKNKEGFENALAEVLGKAMNRNVNFVFWNDPRYVVRDYLDKKKCDVVLGADETDPRMLKTDPYYKTGYVFITKEDRGIDISSWNDDLLKERNFRIGVLPDSPGKVMLLQINRFDDMFDYFAELQHYQSTRNKFVKVYPDRLVKDVETKYIHSAMLWAPEAARYVRASKTPLKIQVVKDDAVKSNGEKVPMHYQIVMGVRKDDSALRDALNRVIHENKSEIDAILKQEGIPLMAVTNTKEGA